MNNKLKAPVACALLGATFLFAACGDEEPNPDDDNNNGGTSSGGTATGGSVTGGTSGAATGGTQPTGGGPTGGTAGTPSGGSGGASGAGGAPGGSGGAAGSAGAPGGAGGMPGGAGGMGGMMCRSPLPMGGMGGMAGAGGAGGSAAGTGGAGGAAAGAGGAGGAAAGAGGAGGAAAGAGGAAAGAGGAAAGAGGAAAGAGGAAAGAGGAPLVLPRVIATFDTPGSLNMAGIGNWGPGGSPPLADTVVSRNAIEGFSCAGAAEIRVPFTAYGTQQDIQINFNPRQNWTGATMLRAKVKVVMPSTGNLNHLSGVQFAANSKPDYSTFQGHYYNASTFADFAWHDVDLPIPGAGATPLDMTQVIQITVQLITQMTAPATGPAAPVTTTLLLDDVWIQ